MCIRLQVMLACLASLPLIVGLPACLFAWSCAVQVVCAELGIDDLSEVFDWIDLQQPIGSASISQVGLREGRMQDCGWPYECF